jgi:exonuclease III
MDIPMNSVETDLCPPEAPILCGKGTAARGICVSDIVECEQRTRNARPVARRRSVNAMGAKYGYIEDFLGRGCYFPAGELKMDYEAVYTDGQAVPSEFGFLTYNMWGLSVRPELEKLFRLRRPLLERTIRDSGADIVCLQEMSHFAYTELTDFIKEYAFASEVPFPSNKVERNRNAEVYFLSKYKPSRVAIYGLRGVLGYENSLMIIEFPNLVVFNLYSQAGSKYSPGQESKWIHYSRCRYDILKTIYDIIVERYAGLDVVLCGDFNFNLDGTVADWPEVEMLDIFKRAGFVDTYRSLKPDDPGFTEDTDRNLMRFNQKLIEKHFRYDGVFYRGSGFKPADSKLIGTELECLTAEDSAWFLEAVTEAKGPQIALLRGCQEDDAGGLLLPINASDHFGVLTRFHGSASNFKGGKRRTLKVRRR